MADLVRRQEEDRREDHTAGLAAGLGLGIHEGPVEPYAWSLGGQHVALRVDTGLFSAEALLRAAYKFTDRCFVFLQRDEAQPNIAWAVLTGKPGAGDIRALVGEFANELVDQRLREGLSREFGPIQTLIVAQAFAEGNLVEPDRDDGDYHADPQGTGRRR